jgi:hypothetical protein
MEHRPAGVSGSVSPGYAPVGQKLQHKWDME